MTLKRIIHFIFFTLFGIVLIAQSENTIGLLSYNHTKSYDGYTLLYPHNQSTVFLIDNCGQYVHTWIDSSNFRPGNTAYLLKNGNLVKTKRDKDATGSQPIWAGGGGEIVEVRSWDNELLHSFELNNDSYRLHHDIAVMPNGNVLLVAWERKDSLDCVESGRNPSFLPDNEIWSEVIFEWNPTQDLIVWQWHAWDHLVQDFDSSKNNFGVVSEKIHKINLNHFINDGTADWLHINSIDYNPILDQIMLSVPYFDEVWIIDHSTSTEEAASSTGGNMNLGGDLLYRIGNASTYGLDDQDQLLFFQHDAHWVNEFVEPSNPYFDHVVVFNNRVGEDYSSIELFKTSWDMYEAKYVVSNNSFEPFSFEQTITHPNPQSFYSTGLSSAQVLPNGNILATSGRQGYLVELTPSNEVVWEYITPFVAGNTANQGDELDLNDNLTFRAFRYPMNYEAFIDKDLSVKGWIENNPNEDYCDRLVSSMEVNEDVFFISPNPANNILRIEWNSGQKFEGEIYDLLGRKHLSFEAVGGNYYLDISSLLPQIYLMRANGKSVTKLFKRG